MAMRSPTPRPQERPTSPADVLREAERVLDEIRRAREDTPRVLRESERLRRDLLRRSA
jgi:hypothetical protein